MKSLKIICISLLITSCNKLKEGDVIEKWYEPETHFTTLTPLRIGKSLTFIPIYHVDREDWVIRIKGVYEGEEREETVYVSQSQYECLSIGNHFEVGKDCSYTDENNERE